MARLKKIEYTNVTIPQDAVEIKVTNIINPYFIRIQKVPVDCNVKSTLMDMLSQAVKFHLNACSDYCYKPKIGDDVIIFVENFTDPDIDLPDQICRGIVTDTSSNMTDVFLLDHGIVVRVPIEVLIIYSRNFIPIAPLTSTVGIYNVLPLNSKSEISTEWSRNSIEFMKKMIQMSSKIYFKNYAFDKNTKKEYGDLFLTIESKNICFSKILIYSVLAIRLHDELLQKIKSNSKEEELSVSYQLCERKSIDSGNNRSNSPNSILLGNEKCTNLKSKNVNQRMLIRSKFTCEPLEYLADSRFTISIHKALKNHGVHTPKQIQSHVWPAMKLGLDVVAISRKASGKAVGYTIPIANYISANEDLILQNQAMTSKTKPIALILCASIDKCINVTTKCKDILYYHDNINCFAAFNGLSDKHIMTNICNKIHILVSTPQFLLRLFKEKRYLNKLDLSMLSFLILDHADVLLLKYFHELMDLIKNYKIINKSIPNSIQNRPMQIVAAAETWTDKIHSFVNVFMENPYICIGSYVEAAVFCKAKARMLIRHSCKKRHEILEALGDYLKIKTMIFCLNSEEATELSDFLASNSIKTLLVHEEVSITKINEIKEEWCKYLSGMYPVIICTDQVLQELQISDIEFLIHYSITLTSKTQFDRRFSVLMNNWFLESPHKCKVLIIIDETKEYVHFKGVLNILTKLNIQLPDDWEEIADRLELSSNLKKANYPLCNYIKLFGACEDVTCPFRHRLIADADAPITNISINDELKLSITFIHDATHFSARVLACIKINSETGSKETVNFPNELLKFSLAISKHYTEPKNRIMVKNIDVGTICVLKNIGKSFYRVQVLNIIETNDITKKPKIVRLRCIDNGQIFERICVFELFEITDEFLNYELAPAIDIFLTNILPIDGEYTWSNFAANNVHTWFKENCTKNSFLFAKVLLHIGNSVWTDSLVVRSKIFGHQDLVSCCLKELIKKKELGIENKKHLRSLLNLCQKSGMTEINGCPIKSILNEKDINV